MNDSHPTRPTDTVQPQRVTDGGPGRMYVHERTSCPFLDDMDGKGWQPVLRCPAGEHIAQWQPCIVVEGMDHWLDVTFDSDNDCQRWIGRHLIAGT